jgi:hydrogenase maturation protease
VLVGVGSPDRGDDAIGPEVIALIAEWVAGGSMGVHAPGRRPFSLPAGTQVLSRSDPTRLIDVLADADLAVIVDAVRTGGPPGTVHVLQAGADQPGPPAAGTGAAPGTHGIGVGDALALARALGRLPERVVIVGVEAERFEMGTPPSAAVQAALVPAARAALHALGHDAPFDVTEPHGRRPHPSSAPPPEPPPDQPRG